MVPVHRERTHTLFFTPQVRTNGLHHYWSGKYRRCPECVAARLRNSQSCCQRKRENKPPKVLLKKDARPGGNNWTANLRMYGEKRTFSLTQRLSFLTRAARAVGDGGAKLQHASDKDLTSQLKTGRLQRSDVTARPTLDARVTC